MDQRSRNKADANGPQTETVCKPILSPPRKWRSLMGQSVPFLKTKCKAYARALRNFMYGMTVHELDMEMRKERGHLDNLFMLVVFGDLIGLPVLPPYYSMRLLPHIVPSLQRWKRRLLREKDLTDFVAGDL